MSSSALKQLLRNQSIWQAACRKSKTTSMSSGYRKLDQSLHYGGWPQAVLSEILLPQHGIGEIRLLSPLLSQLSQKPGYICWINPPFLPNATALFEQQIQIEKLIFIRTQTTQQTIWTAQQAMSSNACSAVLCWLPAQSLNREIRKLSLAVKSGNCWGFILRHYKMHTQPSPAALRITLENTTKLKRQLSIIKQPGGWAGQEITLELFPESLYWTNQAATDWPQINLNSKENIRPTCVTEHKQEVRAQNNSQIQSSPSTFNNHNLSMYH
ncbi:translesion DNA synthesis-associated protein ImuA [Aliikangiella sp. G2MR2-5]|uniref:translesion DNA synthesis-associated protein ImuA n=1 Tax=Aliikangiella sp. G2MR2-5 TaxID=2788943 RepID=UPI0018AB879A|nr:translesion DNA synthesis-associated protein ImuA [Aliikangiella sp. G2MR2-5]